MPETRSQNNLAAPAAVWKLRTRELTFHSGPTLMGILNTTPDSFSDGGLHHQKQQAIQHGLSLAENGAGIIDVGGESTRPYSTPVSLQEELDRTIPVIESLTNQIDTPISIDTSKSIVAEEALKAGAEIINDVTGLEGDPQMVQVALNFRPGICAMHMKGNPQNMQDNPEYHCVVTEILEYLEARKNFLLSKDLDASTLCLDPGIGFGKTHEHNWSLLQRIDDFHKLNVPILVGHSRKGFIGQLQKNKELERDSATAGIAIHLAAKDIQIIRVHNVEMVARTLSAYFKCLPG